MLASALVLVPLHAGLATAGSGVATEHTQAAPDCVASVGEVEAAAALAIECGTEVEVTSARSPWETLYAQPDGAMRSVTSAVAVRAEVDGAWTDVDPTVVAHPDGLAVAAPVTSMTFSDGAGEQPLARLERDGHVLTFDVPFELPEPTVVDARITYPEVLPGVDLVVTVNPDATGFSEVLRVETPEAAANPRLAELEFPVTTSDGLEMTPAGGGFIATDDEGEAVFTSPIPAMWDSRTSVEDSASAAFDSSLRSLGAGPADEGADPGDPAVGPGDGDAVAWLPAEVSDDAVTIAPDASLLTDPETVWPVYIDPQISGSRIQWTAVRDAFGQNWAFGPDEGVGLCNRATSTTCSTTYRSRLLWTFNGLGEIGALRSDQVVSATFGAVGTHSYDCTPRPVTLYRVLDFGPSTPWPGGGYWDPLSTQVVAHKSTCAGQPVRWIEFDATAMARAIADHDTTQGSFGLYADEGSMVNWKRFRNDATFSVTYNREPNLPTNVFVTAGSVHRPCTTVYARVNTTTPVVRAVLSDPDAGSVQGDFDIYQQGTRVFDGPLTAPQASGTEHTFPVPAGVLREGQSYETYITARDPGGKTSPLHVCHFTVDLTPPAVPGIVADPGYATKYPQDGWAGGIGQTGGFQIYSTSPDVVSYRYSFNDTVLTTVVNAGYVITPFTPTTSGPQTLRAQAVDGAGNVSAVATYRFNVTIPTASALWHLDDGAGSVAVDSGPAGNRYPLTTTGADVWGDGPLAELAGEAHDRALVFGAATDGAATAGPVPATQTSFTVGATVRLDAAPTGTATAVSQDGLVVSGFELGYRADGSCADGAPACWSFSMNRSDAAGTATRVTSSVGAGLGTWVYLAGVHNASSDTLKLYVCELEGDLLPKATATVPFTATWNAGGRLRVGRDQHGASPWVGAVADAQVLDGAAGQAQIMRACNRTFSATVDGE